MKLPSSLKLFSTITQQALECFRESVYFLFDRKVIEVSLAFEMVAILSTTHWESPTISASVASANSSKVKLLCFYTTQTEEWPQQQQHLTWM